VFERFTERARQVVVLAQDEARALKHNYIGTEHLLLGVLREEEGIGARVLEGLGVSADGVRSQVERLIGRGEDPPPGHMMPFTPRAKKVLELSLREAMTLGHSYIGTEHILLGIAREDNGVASRILRDFDLDSGKIRRAVTGAVGREPAVGWTADPQRFLRTPSLVFGWLLFGVSLGIGVLIGWAIWGL
jgi:ATP-dependent Clp protease ATP-binding subunit ClpC